MIGQFRSHLVHNVVGYVALFFALGGTAYAVHGSGGSASLSDQPTRIAPTVDRTVAQTGVASRALGTTYKRYVASGTTTDDNSPVLTLPLPRGRYLILAKVTAVSTPETVDCKLIAGGENDNATIDSTSSSKEALMLVVVHRFPRRSRAMLVCKDTGTGDAHDLAGLVMIAVPA